MSIKSYISKLRAIWRNESAPPPWTSASLHIIERPIRCYIAGPITGIPSHNRAAFAEAECALRNIGYEVYNPVAPPRSRYPDHDINDPRPTHLRRDLVELTRAQVLYLLPGYFGTFAEIEKDIALQLDIPVFYRNVNYWKCWRKHSPH